MFWCVLIVTQGVSERTSGRDCVNTLSNRLIIPILVAMLSLIRLSTELHFLTDASWVNKTEKIVLFYADKNEQTTAEAIQSFEHLSRTYP